MVLRYINIVLNNLFPHTKVHCLKLYQIYKIHLANAYSSLTYGNDQNSLAFWSQTFVIIVLLKRHNKSIFQFAVTLKS